MIKIIYIENKSISPFFNHAIEEYFLKETKESVFMIWQNEPTILIGRNQNVELEVDRNFTKAKGIHVVRRLSGGGTVYCDLNNCQYSIITDNIEEKNSFLTFAKPVVEALKKLGLEAEFTGRNDILIDGKKVSGNAQYKWKNRIIHHGTLLFGADTSLLMGSIKNRDLKFVDKSVKSVSSRIGKISEMINMNINDFMKYIRDNIVEYHNIEESRLPNLDELKAIEKYLDNYKDLNYLDDSLKSKYYHAVKYPFGLVEYFIELDGDYIKKIKIAGDFFEEKSIDEFLNKLKGMNIKNIYEWNIDIDKYIIEFDKEFFINDILKAIEE